MGRLSVAPKPSNGTRPALLREGSISVRLLCVMLFYRYLKFFLDMGIRMVRGPEPIRAPDRHRWDGCVGFCMRPLPSPPLRLRGSAPGGELSLRDLHLNSCQPACPGGNPP